MGVASLDLQQTDAGQGKIDYGNIVNKPMINGVTLEGDLSTEDINIFVPQRVSELQNDAGYITKNVSDLVFYYDKTEVDNMISTIPKFDIKVVDSLPTEDISPTTIYLLIVAGEDHYEEYIYVDDEWDKLGDGNIDLSDYATYEYVDAELAEKVDAADLATVALSGRYSDLIGTPVNLSQFTNDVGYLTEVPDGSVSRVKLSSALNADLTAVENAVEGLQNSVRGLSDTKADKTTVSALSDTVALKADKSELPTKTSDLTNDSGFITSADVPTNVSELTNDSGYITSAALTPYSTTQQMNTAISTAVANKADRSEIPTKVSDLTNDSGFVNSTQVNTALAAYTYPSQDLYTQSDIDTMLAQISSLKIEVVNTLPQTGNADTIYLLRVRQQGNDLYQEYFWVNNAWELIGGIDLTDYYTKTEVNTLLTAKADVSAIPTKTSDLTNDSNFAVDANYVHTDNNYTTAEKNKLAGIAAGAEVNVQSNWTQTNSSADDFIKNKPSIPTKTSDLTNDSGFITTAAIPTNISAFNNDVGYLDEIPDDSVGLNQLDSTVVNALNNINNKANTADLAAVAFSGDYDDLTNKPTIPTKTSDLTNDGSDNTAQYLETDETAYKTSSIPYGQCDSTSTATVFTATVPGVTELRDGVCMWLKNGVVTSASGFTININSLGAKPVYNNMAAATRDTTIWNINYTMFFVYDSTRVSGGCWILYRGYVEANAAHIEGVNALPTTGADETLYITGDEQKSTSTATGSTIQIQNDGIANITDFEMQGNAKQTTYSGKNLFDCMTPYRTGGTFYNLSVGTQIVAEQSSNVSITQTSNGCTIAVPSWSGAVYVFPMAVGTTYHFKYTLTSASNRMSRYALDSDHKVVRRLGNLTSSPLSENINITLQNGEAYFAIAFGSNSAITLTLTEPQLELGSTATDYEKFVGGVPAPNPDYPQPVNAVTGEQTVKIEGKNLINENGERSSQYIDNAGNFVSGVANGYVNQQLPTKPNTAYTFSASSKTVQQVYIRIGEYRADGSFIKRNLITSLEQTITTDAECYIIKTCIDVSTGNHFTNPQLELGSQATAYEPYQSQSQELNLGKNLIPFANQDFTVNGVRYYVQNGALYLDGTCTSETLTSHTQFKNNFAFTLEAGTYTFSMGTDGTLRPMSVKKYSDDSNISSLSSIQMQTTFTLSEQTQVYIGFYLVSSNSYSNTKYEIQIERGSTKTEFAPYKTPIELAKIGNYQDRIYKNDGKWYVEKQTGKYTLTGGTLNAGQTSVFYSKAITDYATSSNIPYSEYFTGIDNVSGAGGMASASNNTIAFISTSGDTTPRFYIKSSSFADQDVLNTWLASNPTTVYYALATPTTTEITNQTLINQLEAILSASLYTGVNNIFDETANAVPTMDIEYEIKPSINYGYVYLDGKYVSVGGGGGAEGLAEVALTGDYNDLVNKPTIGDATLTIQKNGTNVQTFTANASSNKTANITVPTTVAELSDSSDYATTTDLATKQNLLSPGNHISITSDVISATGYVHSENPQASAAASSTITGSMIANGTITADKLASDATVKLTMSTSDIGEGAPLAANTLYGVYR